MTTCESLLLKVSTSLPQSRSHAYLLGDVFWLSGLFCLSGSPWIHATADRFFFSSNRIHKLITCGHSPKPTSMLTLVWPIAFKHRMMCAELGHCNTLRQRQKQAADLAGPSKPTVDSCNITAAFFQEMACDVWWSVKQSKCILQTTHCVIVHRRQCASGFTWGRAINSWELDSTSTATSNRNTYTHGWCSVHREHPSCVDNRAALHSKEAPSSSFSKGFLVQAKLCYFRHAG